LYSSKHNKAAICSIYSKSHTTSRTFLKSNSPKCFHTSIFDTFTAGVARPWSPWSPWSVQMKKI
ncbi:hypothetical protein L9F63_016163, partial [Diploptera punctata]